jgi:anti-anti-sigma factor
VSLKIEVFKSAGGKCRIELEGRLDTNTAPRLDETLESLPQSVQVVDLKNLVYISSAGLRSLFRAKKAVASRGGEFLLVHPQPQVQKVFDVMKAIPTTDIFTSEREMDDYLDAIQRQTLAQNRPMET